MDGIESFQKITKDNVPPVAFLSEEKRKHLLEVELPALRSYLKGFCVNHLRSENDPDDVAEDMVQKTMLKAVKGIDSFKGESEFKTWVTSIAIRNILSHLRLKNRNLLVGVADLPKSNDGVELTLDDIMDGGNPEAEMIFKMDFEKIKNNLPDDVKELVPLLAQGYTVAEISKMLKIGEGALKSRLHRFRLKYKSMI